MKKIVFVFIFVLSCSIVFTESNIEKFVKGNISDKTAAVKNATGNEIYFLSNESINFVLKNKEILGNDRELDALAVATVLAFPLENIKSSPEQVKKIYLDSFINLMDSFSDSATVQTAVISKVATFKSFMDISPFVKVLNNILSTKNISAIDVAVVKTMLDFLSTEGDSESFLICYSLWASKRYLDLNPEFENVMLSLLIISINEIIPVTNNLNLENLTSFFNLLIKNKSKINQNSLSEIALNVLSNTILLVKNSQKTTSEITEMQIQALTVLSENKWIRASSVVLSFFEYAKNLYEKNEMSADDFAIVIRSLNNVAPLEAVAPLVSYLGELNSKVERKQEVSETVALAVINTLGAIGDKSAFDALLGVTYFSYPQPVLSAAREALSGLKW